MYLEWDIEWEISMAVAIFTVFLVGFILGGSTVYLVENHFRTKEMNKIYKLTESLINGNDLDDSDIGKETLYSKTANQLIRLQEMLEGRRKEAEKSQYEIQKLISEIAHQLRTPLANIKNYTELLQESLDETQEVLNTESVSYTHLSMMDPDGDFVEIPPLRNADTVIITDDELDDIRSS